MKNTLTSLSLTTLLTLQSVVFAQEATPKSYTLDHHVTSEMEFQTGPSTIPVYKTELNLTAENEHGLSANLVAGVDDQIDQIDHKDFELAKFIRDLNVNYKVENEDTVVLLSVGKMPSGVKIDNDDLRETSGVMGIRLSIEPKKIPLIQDWLTKNQFKINRIDITRYNSNSKDRLNLGDLAETNMTSYAVFLSKGHNIQTFFVYKTPDQNNPYGVTSASLGGVYMMGGKLSPNFFIMKHKSKASFMDLDLMIVSASIEVAPSVRSTLTYSSANESVTGVQKDVYDFSLSKEIKKTKNFTLDASIGVKAERGTNSDNIFYMKLQARF